MVDMEVMQVATVLLVDMVALLVVIGVVAEGVAVAVAILAAEVAVAAVHTTPAQTKAVLPEFKQVTEK
jgi:hypothetical protein